MTTTAPGAGINCRNIGIVIHYGDSYSSTNFQQEGRSGEAARRPYDTATLSLLQCTWLGTRGCCRAGFGGYFDGDAMECAMGPNVLCGFC